MCSHRPQACEESEVCVHTTPSPVWSLRCVFTPPPGLCGVRVVLLTLCCNQHTGRCLHHSGDGGGKGRPARLPRLWCVTAQHRPGLEAGLNTGIGDTSGKGGECWDRWAVSTHLWALSGRVWMGWPRH